MEELAGLEVIDTQVHTWNAESAEFPWDETFGRETPRAQEIRNRMSMQPMPFEQLLQAMDDAEVDAAVLVSHRIYGFDNRYALEAASRSSSRLKVVGILDHRAVDCEEQVRQWRANPNAVGLRLTFTGPQAVSDLQSGAVDCLLAAAETYEVPVCLYPPKLLREVERLAIQFPRLTMVIDHFGLPQSPPFPPEPEPFGGLNNLLGLAQFPNLCVKATALPTLSTEPYPYADLWPHIRAVVDAFGSDRVMWGSDFTRAAAHTYSDAVNYMRSAEFLSAGEKHKLLSLNARRVFNWR